MIRWGPRAAPLAPIAVIGRGAARATLLRALLARDDDSLAALHGVASPDLVLVIGSDLPWVDGAIWLGRDPIAPALLLPTTRAPDAPIDLVQRALIDRSRDGAAPLAVLPGDPLVLVPGGPARPLSRAHLQAALGNR